MILKQPNGNGKEETKDTIKFKKKRNRRIWQTVILVIENPQTSKITT